MEKGIAPALKKKTSEEKQKLVYETLKEIIEYAEKYASEPIKNINVYIKSKLKNEDWSQHIDRIIESERAAKNRAKALAEKEAAERRFKERTDEEPDISKGKPAYLSIMEEEGCTKEEALKIMQERLSWVK